MVTNAINNLGCTAAAVNLRSAYLNTVETALPGSLTMAGLSTTKARCSWRSPDERLARWRPPRRPPQARFQYRK